MLRCFLSQFHQVLRHPAADTFFSRAFYSERPIVPSVARPFTPALTLVIFGLLERQNDALRDVFPVLLLNAPEHQRQTGRPIFIRCARVLLTNRQVVGWGKRPAREFAYKLRGKILV